MQESSLHSTLKDWYAQPNDSLEVFVDGFQIDIVRDELLIEIQTGNFRALREKLDSLLERHIVHLVHPIPLEKWIRRVTADDELVSRRKSPKRGRVEHLFAEMVSLPELPNHPHFSFEVLLTQEEEIWRDDGRGSWRRKGWSVADRRLIDVLDSKKLTSPEDYAALIPDRLTQPFTNLELANTLGLSRRLAGQMTYCLRRMGVITIVGKRDRFNLHLVL